MILFYGMGGGLGHLTRIRAFIAQFEITDYLVASANPQASRLFAKSQLVYLPAENKKAEDYATALQKIIEENHISEIYIDTFPVGILGELSWLSGSNLKLHNIARRLIWKNYAPLIKNYAPLFYEKVYQLEALEPAHLAYLKNSTKEIIPTNIHYPPPNPARITHQFQKPLWLIVHSFHQEEVESLIRYAEDQARIEKVNPTFLVITDQLLPNCPHKVLFDFPAADWFPLADRIFTGGGFNAMQQMIPFKEKHQPFPFPRRFDDQFWRVSK